VGKGGRCVRLTTYHNPVPLSRNLGNLTSWNPLGLFRHVMGLFYLYYQDTDDNSSVNLQNFCWMTRIWYLYLNKKTHCTEIFRSLNKDVTANTHERSLPHMSEYCEGLCMCQNLCSLPDRSVAHVIDSDNQHA